MARIRISQRIIKPASCALGFGIPTSKTSFERSLKNQRSDYARQWKGGWPRYSRSLLADINHFESLAREFQVGVVHDLSLSDLRRLCSGAYDVVILFSHWRVDAVEFSEGLVDCQSIVGAIPDGFDGILDLCVCHPESLVDALVIQRRNCLVRWEVIESKPHIWLFFYEVLFRHLASVQTTYLAALEAAFEAVNRAIG